jgi:hypothetical protein
MQKYEAMAHAIDVSVFHPQKRPVERPFRCTVRTNLAVQADVFAGLGLWRRVDRPILRIQRPPALEVAIDHLALDLVQLCILDGLLGRVKADRRPAQAHDGRGRLQRDFMP